MTVVAANHVTKDYQLGKMVVHALRGIDLAVEEGEFVAVAGSSGSGKSTLLNLIGCLDDPTTGEVWIAGRKVDSLRERQLDAIRRQTIGFIFQFFNLLPVLNVYENIELPLLNMRGTTPAERRQRVCYFLEQVGLSDQLKQRPAELSGGQRQRVAIARALVTKPRIVLADEPTANLDSTTGLEVIELMRTINRREATTFIFSTHDPRVMQYADRILLLEDGLIKGVEKR